MENEKSNNKEYSIKKRKGNEPYFVHELTTESIAATIKEIRKKRNLTIKELANYLDIAASTLSKIENNVSEAKLSTILKILNRLNTKFFFQIELQHFWKKFNAQKIKEQKLKKKRNQNNNDK